MTKGRIERIKFLQILEIYDRCLLALHFDDRHLKFDDIFQWQSVKDGK